MTRKTLTSISLLLILAFAHAGCSDSSRRFVPPTGTTPPSAVAVALRVVTQPQDADVRASLGAVSVEAIDGAGVRVVGFSGSITLSLTTSGLGGLSGATTAVASQGVADFSGLSVDRASEGNTLAFSTSGLTSATSASFVIRSRPVVQAFGLLVFPSTWTDLCALEVRLDGVAYTHADAVGLGPALTGQIRIEYTIARADGANWFWAALGAYGSYQRVLEPDGRYRLDYTDAPTRQTLLLYLQAKNAEAVFFDSVDKPASWGGDTPGLDLMIADVLAAGIGQRVYLSAGGWLGQEGLAPTNSWRRDPRIVVLDEGLDAASYVALGRQAVVPYVLGADFTRFASTSAALEHEAGCVAAVLVLDAEYGVEAWLSTTESPAVRSFQGTPEIQSFDFGVVVGSPSVTQQFAGVQASAAVTFHRRDRAVVVHNTSSGSVVLTVPSTLSEFASGGALVTPQVSRTLPVDGCWVWIP